MQVTIILWAICKPMKMGEWQIIMIWLIYKNGWMTDNNPFSNIQLHIDRQFIVNIINDFAVAIKIQRVIVKQTKVPDMISMINVLPELVSSWIVQSPWSKAYSVRSSGILLARKSKDSNVISLFCHSIFTLYSLHNQSLYIGGVCWIPRIFWSKVSASFPYHLHIKITS